MRFFYDTEFIEDGKTIDLVSIGIVADDGREFYAVSHEFDMAALCANPWLLDNVLPALPVVETKGRGMAPFAIDRDHHHVLSRAQIASGVREFLLGPVESNKVPAVELWAWYGAYDHVALAQLWGRMVDLPEGIPMWTNDLRQETERLGVTKRLPEQPAGLHNALADARHLRARHNFVFPTEVAA